MIVVIQCAASKHGPAFKTSDGREVLFVVDPESAPKNTGQVFAHPDDQSDTGLSWRETLLRYNRLPDNPLKISRAFELYKNEVYRRLVSKLGMERIFILSAGWGLINAAFLTPNYDITFSQSVKYNDQGYKHREMSGSGWNDFNQTFSSDDPVVFFGGKDYVPLFVRLTQSHKGSRTIYYNSDVPPSAPGCRLIRFLTTTRTNWHYACAKAFLENLTAFNSVAQALPADAGAAAISRPTLAAARRVTATPQVPASTSGKSRSEQFRNALRKSFHEAAREGLVHLDINAGDLHRQVGGYPGKTHSMPSCCNILRAVMRSGDVVLSEPASGKGASLTIRYRLPRST